MVIVNVEERKFIVRFQYSPAGVSKYSLRKAVRLLELDFINGDFSFNRAMAIIDGVKVPAKNPKTQEKFHRRKTTCVIQEEIDNDKTNMETVAISYAINDSQEPFTKNYGRTLAYKKAVVEAISKAKLSEDDIKSFELAWKTQMSKSADMWDSIDLDAIKLEHEASVEV